MDLKGKIDNDTAKEIMVDLLSALDEYCKNNNITYFLAYGTLLGAIRHKGFIPWDNDIDIWMPRPDYEKFRVLVSTKSIGNNVRILDYKNERTFPFLKAVDRRTRLKEHFLVTENNLGLYVDIFPLDGLPSDQTKLKRIQDRAYKLNKMFSFANYRFGTGKNLAMKIVKVLGYPLSRCLSSKKICHKLDTLCRDYRYEESEYVGHMVWGYTYKEKLKKTWFRPSTGEFEGHEFVIPEGYDNILKTYYGDYMQLPPEDKRITHYYEVEWKD